MECGGQSIVTVDWHIFFVLYKAHCVLFNAETILHAQKILYFIIRTNILNKVNILFDIGFSQKKKSRTFLFEQMLIMSF